MLVRTENFKRWFGDWERIAEIEHAIDFVLNGEPVSKLTGSEFQQTGNHDLIDRVAEYFRSIGGVVENGELGGVVVDRESMKSSIGHGIGRAKAAAFAAVPEVIRKGVLFDRQRNWKGRGTNTYVIAAPIRIGSENYVCEAIVEEKAGRKAERRFYLHEVNLQSAISDTIKTPTGGASIGNPSRPVRSILAKSAAEINRESVSKVVDENGEPLVVYHGSQWNPLDEEAGKAVFRYDKISGTSEGVGFYFTPDKAIAEGYGDATAVFLNLNNPVYAYSKPKLLTDDEIYDIYESDDSENAEELVKEKAIARAKEKMRDVIGVLNENGYAFNDKVESYLDDIQATTVESLLDYASDIGEYIDGDYDNEQFQADLRNAQMKVFGIDGYYSPNYAGVGAYVAFTPNQIKLANGNAGTFDRWNPDTRYSISHLYTGSAADYEKPSLHYVGSGEGAQVYGWGLYASNKRGVAEGYAKLVRDFNKRFAYRKEGYPENVYEQTFFTDREPGDESHILDWDSVIPKEQGKWFAAQANKEGIAEKLVESLHGVYDPLVVRNLYDAISEVLGSQKAASEFLVRAGIDGVKYEHNGGLELCFVSRRQHQGGPQVDGR